MQSPNWSSINTHTTCVYIYKIHGLLSYFGYRQIDSTTHNYKICIQLIRYNHLNSNRTQSKHTDQLILLQI